MHRRSYVVLRVPVAHVTSWVGSLVVVGPLVAFLIWAELHDRRSRPTRLNRAARRAAQRSASRRS